MDIRLEYIDRICYTAPWWLRMSDFMVYICEKCLFLFRRTFQPDRCPDCGNEAIRPASKEETAEFERLLAEAERNPL